MINIQKQIEKDKNLFLLGDTNILNEILTLCIRIGNIDKFIELSNSILEKFHCLLEVLSNKNFPLDERKKILRWLSKIVIANPEFARYSQGERVYNSFSEYIFKDVGGIPWEKLFLIFPFGSGELEIELFWLDEDDQKNRYKLPRMFAVYCARKILHFFENQYPKNRNPRNALDIAEKFAFGETTEQELEKARNYAEDTRSLIYERQYDNLRTPITQATLIAVMVAEQKFLSINQIFQGALWAQNALYSNTDDAIKLREQQVKLLFDLVFGIITPEDLRETAKP